MSGSGISWAICKSALHSRQITTPTPHHSVFNRPDALLPPNQQRQSTEGKGQLNVHVCVTMALWCVKAVIMKNNISYHIISEIYSAECCQRRCNVIDQNCVVKKILCKTVTLCTPPVSAWHTVTASEGMIVLFSARCICTQ